MSDKEIKFELSENVKRYCRQDVLSTSEAFDNLTHNELTDMIAKAMNKLYKAATVLEFEVIYFEDSSGNPNLFTYVYPAEVNDYPIFAVKGGSAKRARSWLTRAKVPFNMDVFSDHFYVTVRYNKPFIFEMAVATEHNSELTGTIVADRKTKYTIFYMITGKTVDDYVKEHKHGNK